MTKTETVPVENDIDKLGVKDEYGIFDAPEQDDAGDELVEGEEQEEESDPDEQEVEIPSVGKMKVSEIKELRGLKGLKVSEEQLTDRERRLQEQEDRLKEEGVGLKTARKLHELTLRHPKFAEKINSALDELMTNPDDDRADDGKTAKGVDLRKYGKVELEDLPDDVRETLELARQQVVEKAGETIRGMLSEFHEKYPDSGIEDTDDFVVEKLRPRVKELFGDMATEEHVRMVLKEIALDSGATRKQIEEAERRGKEQLKKKLSSLPPGSKLLPPRSSTRKQAENPSDSKPVRSYREMEDMFRGL